MKKVEVRSSKKRERDAVHSLDEFKDKFPEHQFREKNGKIQRLMNKTWTVVCKHNRYGASCVPCGGSLVCEHKRVRRVCKDCKGNGICEHNIRKSGCRICNPNLTCAHGNVKYDCVDCGGSSVCKPHGRRKNSCIDCKPELLCVHNKTIRNCQICDEDVICKHDTAKRDCDECRETIFCKHGTRTYRCVKCMGKGVCEHDKIRQNCALCVGSNICIDCKVRQVKNDGLCISCHPDYIPTNRGASKIACSFIDGLESELNCKISHKHYDSATKSLIGCEFRPPEMPKYSVDGFIAPNIIIEFLGDYYHGHPLHKTRIAPDAFDKTEARLIKLSTLGYHIYFVWERDYRQKGAFVTNESILRTFKEKLEY